MTIKTVADALHVFYELNSEFSNAYWEINEINDKDMFFAMKCMLQDELDELHKLSMQDHEYPYEPINPVVLNLSGKLRKLLPKLDTMIFRTETLNNLERLIPFACELFESKVN
ncbi:hypothetical protein MED121_05870 [Marinomonas sp. MED121]|jgi:hypothetical protein|uniref:hypothetical protein n=1 Tax=Marinomonas sp. MED121 TaxID=314277 RepID=UPI00006902F6|nr:hypothetical protein [Marinomonas sp. MED121]EAQ66185.1 hypothetical protein MED121_05870 [Marinomonas sp. MED121]